MEMRKPTTISMLPGSYMRWRVLNWLDQWMNPRWSAVHAKPRA